MDTNAMDTNKAKTNKTATLCRYGEICSKDKLCGDCGMDKYEKKQYEEALANFHFDRKMELGYKSKY